MWKRLKNDLIELDILRRPLSNLLLYYYYVGRLNFLERQNKTKQLMHAERPRSTRRHPP